MIIPQSKETFKLILLAILVFTSLGMSGCSDSKSDDPKEFSASLRIEFRDRQNGEITETARIACPSGSICSELEKSASCADQQQDFSQPCDSKPYSGENSFVPVLSPDLPDQACTELYGGPQTVTVQGEINGKQVQLERTRTNGCEIAEYDFWAELKSKSSSNSTGIYQVPSS